MEPDFWKLSFFWIRAIENDEPKPEFEQRKHRNVLSRFLREVLSNIRFPGSVGHPTGAAVVRTCAGDRKVEIYDTFHTPGTYMPPTGFVAMTHDTYVQYF